MSDTVKDTPASLGYRLPAEFEPQEATWIAWPHHRADWPGKFGPIPWVYAELVRILSQVEPVKILVHDREVRRDAARKLKKANVDLQSGQVELVKVANDRAWLRDSGPMWVVQDQANSQDSEPVRLIDWRFNAWAKYENWKRDDRIPRRIARELGLKRWKPVVEVEGKARRIVLEGGAIDVNGRGTLLTTEECLLSDVQARNPGLGREGTEQFLADYLGARQVIWLGRGIVGDDTHGHVDDIARFVDPGTVVVAVEENPSDPNFEILQENRERLRSATDQDGQPIRVVELPMPSPVVFDGQRLPASYANFYIANDLVLVPTFQDPADRRALAILADLFPDREVIGIHAVDLVWGLGTLHCLTRDQPKSPLHGLEFAVEGP